MGGILIMRPNIARGQRQRTICGRLALQSHCRSISGSLAKFAAMRRGSPLENLKPGQVQVAAEALTGIAHAYSVVAWLAVFSDVRR